MEAAMRKLVLKMSISLDGFVGGPNGEIDWIFRTVGGDSTEWIVDTIRRGGSDDARARRCKKGSHWGPAERDADSGGPEVLG
jgi:hypothetical protein